MRTSNQIDDQFGTTDTVSRINDSRDQIRQESSQTVDWAKAHQEQQMRDINANNEYREIMYRENYDRLQDEAKRQDSIEKAIAATDPSTGRLSPGQLKLLNENRGVAVDGKGFQDGQIVEGGYIGNTGDYGFVIAHPGSDGTVSYERRRFSRGDLYGMMSNRPDLFEQSQVDEAGRALQAADTSYVPEGRLAGLTAKYKAQIDRRNADIANAENAMSYGHLGNSRGTLRSRLGSGTRGGLDYEQTMARDAAKYDSYMAKNAMGMLEKLLASPAGMEVAKDFLSNPQNARNWVNGFMNVKDSGTGTPAPNPGADNVLRKQQLVDGFGKGDASKRAEEAKKLEQQGFARKEGESDAAYLSRYLKRNGGKNPPPNGAQSPAPTPAPAAAQTEGQEGDIEKGKGDEKPTKKQSTAANTQHSRTDVRTGDVKEESVGEPALSGLGDMLKGGSAKDAMSDEQKLLSVMTTNERGVYRRLSGERKAKYAQKILAEHRDEKGFFGKAMDKVGDIFKGGTDQSDVRRAMDKLTERGKARLRTLRGAEREQYIKDVLSGKVSD